MNERFSVPQMSSEDKFIEALEALDRPLTEFVDSLLPEILVLFPHFLKENDIRIPASGDVEQYLRSIYPNHNDRHFKKILRVAKIRLTSIAQYCRARRRGDLHFSQASFDESTQLLRSIFDGTSTISLDY